MDTNDNSSNVSQLQAPPPVKVQGVSREAEENEGKFLALKLLNKRARVRLSPQAFDLEVLPGPSRLLTVANCRGWFAAAVHDSNVSYSLVLAPLSELHRAFQSKATEEIEFKEKRRVSLPGVPTDIVFAHGDSRLVVGLANGSLIVHDTQRLFSTGTGSLDPVYTSPPGRPLRHISPNPGDMSELVAILRAGAEVAGELAAEVFDVQKLQMVGGWQSGGTPQTQPTSLSWSAKGKLLALGLASGNIISFSPTTTSSAKIHAPAPGVVSGQQLIFFTWLSNTEFYNIYAQQGSLAPDVEQTHIAMTFDPKSNSMNDVKLTTPYFPYPGLKHPGAFHSILRGWDSAKFLLFIGDSTSSDIGLVGNVHGNWCNVSLEDTARPAVPLDKESNETLLLGLELDLTWTEKNSYTTASGEEVEVPPPPVMYAYASDGTLTGWHIIHTTGTAYPGMVGAAAPTSTTSPQIAQEQPAAPVTTSAFSSPTVVEPVAAPSFGQPANAPAFSQPAFGQPAFSQTPAFGAASTVPSSGGFAAFANTPATFASTGFGATVTSRTPTASSMLSVPAPEPMSVQASMQSQPDDDMAAESDTGFGGLSLGGGSSDKEKEKSGGGLSIFGAAASGESKPGAFGAFGSTDGKPPAGFGAFGGASSGASSGLGNQGSSGSAFNTGLSAFGGDSQSFVLKPASGFGAFANQGPSPFASATSSSEVKPPTGFGAFANNGPSALGATIPQSSEAKATDAKSNGGVGAFADLGGGDDSGGATSAFGGPTFGQSSFGQPSLGQPSAFGKPAFGQTAFGQTAFGQSAFSTPTAGETKPPTTPTTSPAPSSGGFAAFAAGGFAGFRKAAEQTATTTPASSPAPSSGAFSAFASSGPSPFGKPAGESSNQTTTPVSSPGPSAFSAFAGKPSVFGKAAAEDEKAAAPLSGPGVSVNPLRATPVRKAADEDVAQTTTPASSPGPSAAFNTFAQGDSFPKAESSGREPVVTTPAKEEPVKEELQRSPSFSAVPLTPTAAAWLKASPQSSSPDATPVRASKPQTASDSEGSRPASPESPSSPTLGSPEPPKHANAFTSTTPAPSTGAFGGLTSTPNAFGSLNSGFGLFGSTDNSSSPFFRAAQSNDAPPKPVALFGASAASPSTPTPQSSSKPAFGAPSAIGSANSAFGGPSAFNTGKSVFGTSPPAASAPTTGGFAAFSGATSAFGAAASQGTSFGDLLRQKDAPKEESKTPQKPLSVFATLGSTTPASRESTSSEQEEEVVEGDAVEGEEDEYDQEDAISFLSETFSEESEEHGLDPIPEESSVPSSPAAQHSELDEDEAEINADKGKSVDRLESTTPPGTPAKTSTVVQPPTPAPPSPAGIGLGRPSSRPARSSPLANAPITGSDSEDNDASKTEQQDTRGENKKLKTEGQTSQPKTPPLLSAFGTTPTPAMSPFTLSPVGSPAFGATSVSEAKPAPATGTNFFGPKVFSLNPSAGKDASDTSKAPTAELPKPFAQFSGGLFGSKATTPATSSTVTPGGSTTPLFGRANPPPSPVSPVATGPASSSLFGAKPSSTSLFPNAPEVPKATSPTPTPAAFGFGAPSPFGAAARGGLFSKPAAAPSPLGPSPAVGPSFFGKPTHATAGPAIPAAPFGGLFGAGKPAGAPVPDAAKFAALAAAEAEAAEAEGMQRECMELWTTLTQELEDLRGLATEATKKREGLSKGSGRVYSRADLGTPTKWAISDLSQFSRIMKSVEQNVEAFEVEKANLIALIQDLEGSMLKATTRKEEIARFDKATKDEEFAKMLKARMLGPEHLEAQNQLRRDIKVIRDRIEQLEDHIQEAKKKLRLAREGKAGLKAPSLATINRIYNNIDTAIVQEEDHVKQLVDRTRKLDLNALSKRSRDARLPDKASPKLEVTPHVASTTAAALNAEMSARKLKTALLAARKEPLLNTKALTAKPAPPRRVEVPKPSVPQPNPSPFAGMSLPAWQNSTPKPDSFVPITESAPVTPVPATPHANSSRRASGSNKRHAPPIALKRGGMSSTNAPPANFSWGPLPPVTPSADAGSFVPITPVKGGLPVPLAPTSMLPVPISPAGFTLPVPITLRSPLPVPITSAGSTPPARVTPSPSRSPLPVPIVRTQSMSPVPPPIIPVPLSSSWVTEGFDDKKA